jgi:hypothetical protein
LFDFTTAQQQTSIPTDPGISHNRGRTLWELYTAKMFVLTQQWTSKTINKTCFKQGIKDLIPFLEETKHCLNYNEEGTVEYHILTLATKALFNTKETLTFIDFM